MALNVHRNHNVRQEGTEDREKEERRGREGGTEKGEKSRQREGGEKMDEVSKHGA